MEMVVGPVAGLGANANVITPKTPSGFAVVPGADACPAQQIRQLGSNNDDDTQRATDFSK